MQLAAKEPHVEVRCRCVEVPSFEDGLWEAVTGKQRRQNLSGDIRAAQVLMFEAADETSSVWCLTSHSPPLRNVRANRWNSNIAPGTVGDLGGSKNLESGGAKNKNDNTFTFKVYICIILDSDTDWSTNYSPTSSYFPTDFYNCHQSQSTTRMFRPLTQY